MPEARPPAEPASKEAESQKDPAPSLTHPPDRNDHRGRLIYGMVQVVAAKGYREATVQDVLEASGVSRATFYVHFADKQECFLVAHDIGRRAMWERGAKALSEPGPWPIRMREALRSILQMIAEQPVLARLWIVDALSAGPEAIARYADGVATFEAYVAQGAELTDLDLPPEIAQHVIRGIVVMIYGRIVAGETDTITELLPALTYSALAPFVGPEEAWRVANEQEDG